MTNSMKPLKTTWGADFPTLKEEAVFHHTGLTAGCQRILKYCDRKVQDVAMLLLTKMSLRPGIQS